MSKRVLGDLGAQLDRLEKELAAREHRVARAEQEVRQAAARVQAEREKLSAGQSREQELAGQLAEHARRVEELRSALQQRDQRLREALGQQQALKNRLAPLTAQRDMAIQERTRAEAALADAKAKLTEATSVGPYAAIQKAPDRPTVATRKTRWLSLGALVICCLVAVITYLLSGSTSSNRRLIGTVTASPGDERTLTACSEAARAQGITNLRADVQAGVLELILETPDADAGIEIVNNVGRSIAGQFHSEKTAPAATRPFASERRRELAGRIADLDRRLAQATAAASMSTDEEGKRLIEAWSAAQADRRRIEQSLAVLASRPAEPLPDASIIRIDPTQLAAAEQADDRLRTELNALTEREKDLVALLRGLLTDGDARLDTLPREVIGSQARLNEALQGDYSEGINTSLRTMRESVSRWGELSSTFADVWRWQNQSLTTPAGVDLLACQSSLEQAARTFIDTSAAAQVRFDNALKAIGQDSEQPTKGLVLQRTLTQDLDGVIQARQTVVTVTRTVMLANNLELSAVVQQVAGLRRQVEDRRSRIETNLRQQALAQLQEKREQTNRSERQRLEQQRDELDRAIADHVANARRMIQDNGRQQAELITLITLHRERADALKELADIDTALLRQLADAPDPIQVHYVPARMEAGNLTGSPRVRSALLAGGGCLIVCLLVLAGLPAVRSWQTSRQTIEDYTRQLQEAAGQRTRTPKS